MKFARIFFIAALVSLFSSGVPCSQADFTAGEANRFDISASKGGDRSEALSQSPVLCVNRVGLDSGAEQHICGLFFKLPDGGELVAFYFTPAIFEPQVIDVASVTVDSVDFSTDAGIAVVIEELVTLVEDALTSDFSAKTPAPEMPMVGRMRLKKAAQFYGFNPDRLTDLIEFIGKHGDDFFDALGRLDLRRLLGRAGDTLADVARVIDDLPRPRWLPALDDLARIAGDRLRLMEGVFQAAIMRARGGRWEDFRSGLRFIIGGDGVNFGPGAQLLQSESFRVLGIADNFRFKGTVQHIDNLVPRGVEMNTTRFAQILERVEAQAELYDRNSQLVRTLDQANLADISTFWVFPVKTTESMTEAQRAIMTIIDRKNLIRSLDKWLQIMQYGVQRVDDGKRIGIHGLSEFRNYVENLSGSLRRALAKDRAAYLDDALRRADTDMSTWGTSSSRFIRAIQHRGPLARVDEDYLGLIELRSAKPVGRIDETGAVIDLAGNPIVDGDAHLMVIGRSNFDQVFNHLREVAGDNPRALLMLRHMQQTISRGHVTMIRLKNGNFAVLDGYWKIAPGGTDFAGTLISAVVRQGRNADEAADLAKNGGQVFKPSKNRTYFMRPGEDAWTELPRTQLDEFGKPLGGAPDFVEWPPGTRVITGGSPGSGTRNGVEWVVPAVAPTVGLDFGSSSSSSEIMIADASSSSSSEIMIADASSSSRAGDFITEASSSDGGSDGSWVVDVSSSNTSDDWT
jgi:hypothetical protein